MKRDEIIKGNRKYKVIRKLIEEDRPNANIFLCADEDGKRYIAKHFYKNHPMPNVAYGKKNHFGRRRDGSRLVFSELHSKSLQHSFLIDHIERIKHYGKWVIILEYVEGVTFDSFIRRNASTPLLVENAVKALAEKLAELHNNGFAHGDPHLDNCLIEYTTNSVLKATLIDYCQLHHKDFKYCKQYGCFDLSRHNRQKQDLNNETKHFGRGFRAELIKLERGLSLGSNLSNLFDKYYYANLIKQEIINVL